MVDEGQAAVGGDPPGRAAGAPEAGAEEVEASAEVVGPPEEIPCARAAPPSPSTASGASRGASASGAAPAPTPRRGGAGDEAARRALVAGIRRASIALPLWKVCARPRPCIRLLPRVARASPLPRPLHLSCTRMSALLRALSGRARFCLLICLTTSLSQVLRRDQVEGVRWLFRAVADGGGLLGDEPGLGKTVQIITVLEALIRARLARKVLIIAPANLISNWKAVRPPPLALSPSLPSPRDASGPASLCSLRRLIACCCHMTSGVSESSALARRIALASPPPLAGTQTSGTRRRQVRASSSSSRAVQPSCGQRVSYRIGIAKRTKLSTVRCVL
jgi:hypothetical protein